MLHRDTSVVVSLVTNEPSTDSAQQWLAAQSAVKIAISDWVSAEVASAVPLIQRVGRIDDVGRARAARNLRDFMTDVLVVLPVSRHAFRVAGDLAGLPQLGLRAGDALHLAVALEHDVPLVTRDVAQHRAASAIDLPTQLLETGSGA